MNNSSSVKVTAPAVAGFVCLISFVDVDASITRLAGGDTPVPNGAPGDIFGFIDPAAYDDGGYAFAGANSPQSLSLGVFRGTTSSPDLQAVLDQSMNLPGAPGPATAIFSMSKDHDSLALYASAPNPGSSAVSGLFTQLSSGDAVVPVALRSDPIRPSVYHGLDGGFVYFEGFSASDSSVRGIYAVPIGGGTVTPVVDNTTPVPGQPGKTFTDFEFRGSGVNGGTLAFSASWDGGEGVFLIEPGQAPQAVYTADTVLPTSAYGDKLPDNSGSALGAPAYDDGLLVFSAEFDTFQYEGTGFYQYHDGLISLIVDSETVLPNDPSRTFGRYLGATTFPATAADYVVDNGRVFFDSNQGIYQYDQGSIVPIVLGGEEIDGEILFGWGLPHSSVSGEDLVFYGYTVAKDGLSYTTGVFLTPIAPDLAGDLNADGFVGIADLNIVLGAWNQNVPPGELPEGDPSGDGFVGIADLNIVLGNWNAGVPPGVPEADASIPEPGVVSLIGVAGLWMAGVRSHRSKC